MSGSSSLGGASFDLGVGLEKFRTDLAQARAIALEAAGEIQGVLNGQSGQTSGYGRIESELRDVQQAALAADGATIALIRTFDAAGNAANDASGDMSQLAQSMQAVTDNARGMASAVTGSQTALAAQGRAVSQQAGQVAQAVTQQAQAATQAATAASVAVAGAGARTVDAEKAKLAVQTALNSLRTGTGRENVETGQTPLANAVTETEKALARVQAGNFGGSFDSITSATTRARASLVEVNAELVKLAGSPSGGGITIAAKMIAEIEELAAKDDKTPAQEQRFGDLVSNLRNIDESVVEEGETFNQLNTQAKTLTTSLKQLATAQEELQGRAQKVVGPTRDETAALKAQQDAVERKAREDRSIAQAASVQKTISDDPTVLGAIQSNAALEKAGLSAKEAQNAVNGLQQALNSVNGSQSIKNLQTGFEQSQKAAVLLREAMVATAGGDVQAALAKEAEAIDVLKRGLLEARIAAQQLEQSLRGAGTEIEKGVLSDLKARSALLQSAVQATERSTTGLQGPEVRLQKEAENEATRVANNLTRQGRDLERERGREVQATSRFATALQNVLGSIGLGNIGRPAGGVGRASADLELAGITASTAASLALVGAVTALGAALVETVRAGIGFNLFIETAGVRMSAASGSAAKAQQQIELLKRMSTSRDFGSFGTEDLAAGLEKLERLGQNTPDKMQKIADVAAATGQTFGQVATQLAVFYDRLRSGLPLDDTLQGLINAGVLTAELASQLRAADVAGADVTEKVAIFDKALQRFEGTAKKSTDTTAGGFQRLKNEAGILAGALTEATFRDMADAVDVFSNALNNPGIARGLKQISEVIPFLLSPVPTVIKRAAGAVGIGVSAPEPAAVPGAPARIDLAEDRYNRNLTAFQSGQGAVKAFAEGFDAASRSAFVDIEQSVRTHLEALAGGNFTDAMRQKFGATIEPLLAQIVKDIQDRGSVSVETAGLVVAALGTEGQRIIDLAEQYAKLRVEIAAVADAEKALATAKSNLDTSQNLRTQFLGIDQGEIDKATDIQKKNDDTFDQAIKDQQTYKAGWQELARIFHDAYQGAIDALDEQIRSGQAANKIAAENARAAIQGLQDGLASYQDEVSARRQDADDALAAMREALGEIQSEIQAAQSASSQHAAAYQAVLAGTIDYFNQEHTQQDEITRAIITKWDAEISGLRRAKDESDNRVRAQTQQEHALTLAYEKRIAAARAAGREDQARALERERDRVIAAQRRGGAVDRAQADVDADRLGNATRDAGREAAGVASNDQVLVNQAQDRATAAQKELDAFEKIEAGKRREEDAEVKRRQEAITHATRVEADRARAAQASIDSLTEDRRLLALKQTESDKYYKSITDGIDTTITRIQTAKEKQHDADQQKIDDAKLVYDADKKYWDDRVKSDEAAVTNAGLILAAANDAVTARKAELASLQDISREMDKRLLQEITFLNILRAQRNLPPLPVVLPGTSQSPVEGNVPEEGSGSTQNPSPPIPTVTPATGGSAPNGPGTGPGRPTPPPGLPPIFDATLNPSKPNRYHQEVAPDGKPWWVADNHTLAEYPEGQAPSTSLAPAGDSQSQSPGFFGKASLSARAPAPPPVEALSIGWGSAPLLTGVGPVMARGGMGLTPSPYGGSQVSQASGQLTIHIDRVDASSQQDVSRLLGQIEDQVLGSGLAGFEIAKRGGLWPGKFGAQS